MFAFGARFHQLDATTVCNDCKVFMHQYTNGQISDFSRWATEMDSFDPSDNALVITLPSTTFDGTDTRSAARPQGLQKLTVEDKKNVQVVNEVVRRSSELMSWCTSRGLPCVCVFEPSPKFAVSPVHLDHLDFLYFGHWSFALSSTAVITPAAHTRVKVGLITKSALDDSIRLHDAKRLVDDKHRCTFNMLDTHNLKPSVSILY